MDAPQSQSNFVAVAVDDGQQFRHSMLFAAFYEQLDILIGVFAHLSTACLEVVHAVLQAVEVDVGNIVSTVESDLVLHGVEDVVVQLHRSHLLQKFLEVLLGTCSLILVSQVVDLDVVRALVAKRPV